ncbi:MSMEG_1061 family FMN-dependent PPOX-type flavoprotein [Agromyces seonyuensis]|uniref:Pyridoxamine 5'-phosphate oxidase family protein n=1 Tax=Agromyces seonyuensis TaxID=2662446 RepID=A0A6I4P4K0_9MICO|nr:MSMEG_1061 family FMN-dependent PPOX-type flavoprotein [Agromyces seonyuensis]MWB98347.1 pyridoxamine 5'-phosphate oxidase family protein [Agromyces seonyuensis]
MDFGGTQITTRDELESIVGTPNAAARDKERDRLHELDRAWLAASPLYFVATGDARGLDVSPKGDPAGSVLVLDDRTIALPERPGNRRADGFHNLLTDPRIGLIFVIPGRGDTLRVNGRARILRDAPYAERMLVRGHTPTLVVEVAVEEVFHHCSKAFLRSKAWDPATWAPEALVPRRAVVAKSLDRRGDALEDLDAYYGPSYEASIYG